MEAQLAIDLMRACVEIALLCGALGCLAGRLVGQLLDSAAEAVMRRMKPPSPAVLLALATGMRKRAAALEIEAAKQNAAMVAANDKKRGHPWVPELQR